MLNIIITNQLLNPQEYSHSMIKRLDNFYYIGGKNSLSRYELKDNELKHNHTATYTWTSNIMNGSDIGFVFKILKWPPTYPEELKSMAFDTCLNWKQEHKNESVRTVAFDYQHLKYHTPSGDFETMNFICMNSFIRAVEPLDETKLWVCGTFGAFPRAFSVRKSDLTFIKFVDINMMTCARYLDEPMATYRDQETDDLYVASGWGLYRPDKQHPDVPNNNSTMLYSDWRLYKNLFTLPSAMAWVLSSDVNFIPVVKVMGDFLYFFGHEVSNQYGLNNQEDRHAWQSFMLRICKKDPGFKYIPLDIVNTLTLSSTRYHYATFDDEDFYVVPDHKQIDYNSSWYDDIAHLPKTHFITPLKVNFGCFISKRPRAISDNHFWGETNVVYLNKLADVLFDPNRTINFKTQSDNPPFGCSGLEHHQIPLIGLFNREGIAGTAVEPVGALCQLQINENIFNEKGTNRGKYFGHNILEAKNAYEEIMGLSSTSFSNFYSRTLHRTNGYTLYPYWNQGVMIGDNLISTHYHGAYQHLGKCYNKTDPFYKSMNVNTFLRIQNFSNTAWPNELPNRLSSLTSSVCQYSSAELYGFNATFVVPGVEFKKFFLIKDNITDYIMNEINGTVGFRRHTSPLMLVGIISTSGHFYRVVLCDFDNSMSNHGKDKTNNEWYNWCIFRNTEQPYIYRQYFPMEKREWGDSLLYRASSLLNDVQIVTDKDKSSYLNNVDPQFHIVKDVLSENGSLHVLTSSNIYSVKLNVDCSLYKYCIHCASDPQCMWNIITKKCHPFKNYIKEKHVQDVLDRGLKCMKYFSVTSKSVHKTHSIFQCNNAGFWRGKIVWKVNGKDISNEKDQYLIDTNSFYLIIKTPNIETTSLSCHGLQDDYDKLYRNVEYDWRKSMSPTALLDKYYLERDYPVNGLLILLYILTFIGGGVSFVILVWVYWHFHTKIKKRKLYLCHPSQIQEQCSLESTIMHNKGDIHSSQTIISNKEDARCPFFPKVET